MQSNKKRIGIEILLHLVFWAGVFYVLTSLNVSHIHVLAKKAHIVRDTITVDFISTYVYIILFFLAALFYGNIFWVFPKVIRYKSGLLRMAICAGWLAVVFGANYFIAGPFFDQANPIPEPPPFLSEGKATFDMKVKGTAKLDRIIEDQPRAFTPDKPPNVNAINFMISDWGHIQPVILFAFIVILGISIAYFFLKEWAKSELIQTQLQANQLSTEIKFLKAQVNPHFLFNTLNNLFSMAQAKGNDELADGISKLSGMMRYMLYDSNEEAVPLSKEIIYLEECITLNKLRYAEEEVAVTFDHAEQIAEVSVAPMLFIPFVENAFKHGVAIGQTTAIQITVGISGQKLNFSCVNTDHSAIRKMGMEISGIGLENVKRRLELVYPGKHQLVLKTENGKFMVNLEIELS